VLSIAKLRVGQEAYQLSGVAQSLDDYYTGAGEAPGHWLGAGAEALGLEGEVAPEDLRAVLAGLAPGSGGLTPDGTTLRTRAARVPGFDLTFKAPKSVSVLYAVSDDPRVQGAIVEAGDQAVRATLAWIEREAIRVRRGTGNEAWLADLAARDPAAAAAARIRVEPARGMVAATFRHRTSRAGDPLLHWHTLVANLAQGPDGRWSAFLHPELYRNARAAGEVFQTLLRGELTKRLGLEWRPGRHVPELAGVPQTLCDLFSKRSGEIDAWLAATGTPDDRAGRQAAVLATRRHKPEREGERFDAAWKAEAAAAGWGPTQADALLAAAVTTPPARPDASREPVAPLPGEAGWVEQLTRRLTEHDSTFTRPDLVQAVAAALPGGADVATVERRVAEVLASPTLVPINAPRDGGQPRWTTTEWLMLERRFLDRAAQTRRSQAPANRELVELVLAGLPALGHDQARAVRVLCQSTDAVTVMVGPAGTGKTFALDAVRQIYESAGYHVIGAAPSARAAHELEVDAQIPSSTVHRLAGAWTHGYGLPDAATVLIVDEAAMAGLRDLDHLVGVVTGAGGRVVLVGDHHQLPEVTAGGGFAALATDPATTVAELVVNRRQREPWERDALAELRDGRVSRALATYLEHDRVEIVSDRPAMVDAAVARWIAAHEAGLIPVLLAGTNRTVDALNTAVRAELCAHGLLGADVDIAGGAGRVAIGERLMIRRNDYQAATLTGDRTHVLNGQTGTLTGADNSSLWVRMDHDDRDVRLPKTAWADRSLGYAWASTAHRAQGGTWDLAITVGLDGLSREAGYLVMSRGRHANVLIVSAPDLAALHDSSAVELDRHDSPLPLPSETRREIGDELLERLSRSRRKQLALTLDPHADAVHAIADHLDLVDIERWAAHAAAVETDARHHYRGAGDPGEINERLDRLEHTAHHITAGHRVRATDRHNIGTVVSVDDARGIVEVLFNADDGRSANRTLAWADVHIVVPRHPEPRILDPIAATTLERLRDQLRTDQAEWHQLLGAHGVQPHDHHIYRHAARLVVDRATAQLSATQPDWLTDLLGARPSWPPAATQIWDDTVRTIATARLHHDIPDMSLPIGPDNPRLWTRIAPEVTRARVWLDTHTTRSTIPTVRTRSVRELRARRVELDAIFADAPPDQRTLINHAQDGALTLNATTDILQDALAAQGQRRRWILEHWPHVVEAAEITRTLDTHAAGADTPPLLAALAQSSRSDLAADADDAEPWLDTLLSHLANPADPRVDPALEQLLGDIVQYRRRWNITGPEPLGNAASDVDQNDHRRLLDAALRSFTLPEHCLEDDADRFRQTLFEVDVFTADAHAAIME
jgi:conjugative relaxase-like TrwC/TraI family protein